MKNSIWSSFRVIAALAFAAACSSALAQGPRLDAPMRVPQSLKDSLPDVGSLVGLYATSRDAQLRDLRAIQSNDDALDNNLVALVADLPAGQFHFTNQGLAISLEESELSLTRQSRPVNFENACAAWPLKGDKLLARYEGAGWSAELTAVVDSHVPYISRNGALEEVAPGDSRTCAAEVGAQTYYTGSLTLSFDGKVVRATPLVVYNLQLP
jgi:hypothetical protein